ncbi:nucleolar protein 6-like isoform X2 [Mytilus edulis]|uniref:nucleolar protein 6-like isoform X2 n=1 Tax=Mytilus edulis TaxID=6550 RepID=UPI0039EE68E5
MKRRHESNENNGPTEEVEALTEDALTEDVPEKKTKKIDKGQLYKPLSSDELHQLKDAENLFHSNVFKLQITELLNEVQLKGKRISRIHECIKDLKSVLLHLPRGKEHDLGDCSWLPDKVKLPLINHGRTIKGKFKFLPPIDVQEIGSFSTGTCLRPNPSVDLQLTIPKDFFQPKDYMNHRYIQKRALYLSVIALKLQKQESVQNVKFSYQNGNTLKPILALDYKGEGKEVTFHLHVCPEEGTFKYSRFHINKNNVRQSWFKGQESEEVSSEEPATPHYNTAILQDLTMTSNNQCMKSALQDASSVKEGISLLRIWLQQRELDMGHGGFSGFTMSMYVIYLLSRRKLNKMMSNYQIMRNTLLQLAKENWTEEGPDLCGDKSDPNQPMTDDFQQIFNCVFLDLTGYVNLCSEMTKSTFLRVKHEAELAVKILEDKTVDSFHVLFLMPVKFTRKFEHIFHVTCIEELKNTVDKLNLHDRLLDYGGNYVHTVIPNVMSLLQRALNKRIDLVQIKQYPLAQWDIKNTPPSIEDQKVTIGISLNPEFAFSSIDKGPPADSPEAKEFREFWGEKSELRRFKDSSITEAVPWTTEKSMDRRRIICSYVVKEVMKRWAKVTHISYIGDQLDQVLSLPIQSYEKNYVYGTGEEQHSFLMQSYDNLCKVLRNLKDMPLTINSIQGTSPVFRFTEVFPALPATFFYHARVSSDKKDLRLLPQSDKPCPPYTAVTKVICLLEGSGHWPDDKNAFKRIKAALHIKFGEILGDQHDLPVAIDIDHVDVRFEDYVFRLELQYLREIALLKKVTSPDGMVKFVDNDEALRLEQDIKLLPILTSTLHGIQQKFNSFSGSVRLVKRWISSQLLADHVPDIAVELMVAYLYTSPGPYTVPYNPLTGFLRFLHLVSTFDWKMSPLVVNLNAELKGEDYSEITSNFAKSRSSHPVMFISTPQDRFQSVWTKKHPTPMILQRLVILATECLQIIESQIGEIGPSVPDFKQIFRPAVDDFDLLIHLRGKQLACDRMMIDRQKKLFNPPLGDSLDRKYKKNLPVYDYDPVQKYLQEIREKYCNLALFFYDRYGGQVIGVLFNPNAFQPKEFSVNHMFCRKPETSQNGHTEVIMKPNIAAIREDFAIIGEGLVASVQMLKSNLK